MKLIRSKDDGSEEVFDLAAGAMILGRKPRDGITIADTTVSREHARIFQRDGAWHVADLNSSNGTFVNDERVTRVELKPGDVVRLGAVELRVEAAPTLPFAPPPVSPRATAPLAAVEDEGITLEEPPSAADEPGDMERTIVVRPAHRFAESGAAAAAPGARRSALPSRPASTAKGTVLTHDLGQYSFLMKTLLVLVVVAIAVGLFFGARRLTERVVPEGGFEPASAEETDEGE